MPKVAIEKAVAMALALNNKIKPELLSDSRHRHSFNGITVTLVNEFNFEAMTIDLGAGALWFFYKDMELFRLRRGVPVAATDDETRQIESVLEWEAETLAGLQGGY